MIINSTGRDIVGKTSKTLYLQQKIYKVQVRLYPF